MQDHSKKINDKLIIGELSIDGKVYFVDEDKTIYSEVNQKYQIVNDKETLQRILDYISPKSIDIEM